MVVCFSTATRGCAHTPGSDDAACSAAGPCVWWAQLLELEEALATAQAATEAASTRVEELAISLEQARRNTERQTAQLAAATAAAANSAAAAAAAVAAGGPAQASAAPVASRTNTAQAPTEPYGLSLTDELELARSLATDRLQEVASLRSQKEALIKELDTLRHDVRVPSQPRRTDAPQVPPPNPRPPHSHTSLSHFPHPTLHLATPPCPNPCPDPCPCSDRCPYPGPLNLAPAKC